jgi:hypothetical protein
MGIHFIGMHPGKDIRLSLTGKRTIQVSYSTPKQTDSRCTRRYGNWNKCSASLVRGATNSSQSCRQLRGDTAQVLYRSMSFSSFNATGFRDFRYAPHRPRQYFLQPWTHSFHAGAIEGGSEYYSYELSLTYSAMPCRTSTLSTS